MITYDYKYTEIELSYADFDSGEIRRLSIEIKGHRKQRNRKLIRRELESLGIPARDWSVLSTQFKERQYRMTESDFMKVAQPSLF